jgi:hypothetical protein
MSYIFGETADSNEINFAILRISVHAAKECHPGSAVLQFCPELAIGSTGRARGNSFTKRHSDCSHSKPEKVTATSDFVEVKDRIEGPETIFPLGCYLAESF